MLAGNMPHYTADHDALDTSGSLRDGQSQASQQQRNEIMTFHRDFLFPAAWDPSYTPKPTLCTSLHSRPEPLSHYASRKKTTPPGAMPGGVAWRSHTGLRYDKLLLTC